MTKDKPVDQELQKIIMSRVIKLNATVLGIVIGTLLGFAILLSTIWLVIKGGDVVGPHLALLGQYFFGYEVTVAGSFIGFAYGFVSGFIIGYAIGAIYNWVLNLRDGRNR